MSATVREDLVLSHAVVAVEVEAPFNHVDISHWLKTLPTHEHSGVHRRITRRPAIPSTTTGPQMSINVEMIGTGLVVQQYRFEVEPQYLMAAAYVAAWARAIAALPHDEFA
jgi:hypothetical protein